MQDYRIITSLVGGDGNRDGLAPSQTFLSIAYGKRLCVEIDWDSLLMTSLPSMCNL